MKRRTFLQAAGVASVLPRAVMAQDKYPSKLITWICPYAAGGNADIRSRQLSAAMAKLMNVVIIVDNKPGAGGNIGTEAIVRAKPDGYTLGLGNFAPMAVNKALFKKINFDPLVDLTPIMLIEKGPLILMVKNESPYKTVKDVVEHARSGQGRWGAANPASLERQTMERLKQKAGVNPAVATFEGGGDMLINVLNHTLDMGVGELQEMRGQLDAGKIRLLGVVGDERITQFPDLQTVKEQGIDLSVRKFRGLAGPKGMPRDLIARWETAVRALLDDPEYKKLYIADGLQPGFMPHDQYVAFMNTFGNETAAFLKESGVIR